MSADLELRLPIIKTVSSQTSDVTEESGINREDCRTPKSPERMIPPVLSCPPPPRKPPPRRMAASCKRKLCEVQFFEIVAREEVESFFRTFEENINGGATKRRCVV